MKTINFFIFAVLASTNFMSYSAEIEEQNEVEIGKLAIKAGFAGFTTGLTKEPAVLIATLLATGYLTYRYKPAPNSTNITELNNLSKCGAIVGYATGGVAGLILRRCIVTPNE